MIGAHVPRKPATRARRCQLCESAALINRAYDERFARKNAHLVWLRHGFNS